MSDCYRSSTHMQIKALNHYQVYTPVPLLPRYAAILMDRKNVVSLLPPLWLEKMYLIFKYKRTKHLPTIQRLCLTGETLLG